MPAFVAPLVGFALGALLAAARPPAPGARARAHHSAPDARPHHSAPDARPHHSAPDARSHHAAPDTRAHQPPTRPLALASLFALLVFAPICAYFLLFAPDWSLAYLIDSRRVPSAIDLVLILLDAASIPAGFLAFDRIAAWRSLRAMGALIGVPLALAALAVLLFAAPLSLDGTYRQVHGDFGVRAVAGGPLGYALLWMTGLLIAGLALTVRAIRGHNELPARPSPADTTRQHRPERPRLSIRSRSLPPDAATPRSPAAPPDAGRPRRRLGGG